ncbi:VOC family protein [Tabrizicola sp.]|uniref:VOC family protein n=1 Tax=Tabrizicola sp. TaxID=2005166 RepID=UPI00286A3FF9|nr:VOC family protein [Tabrizicola sp.]
MQSTSYYPVLLSADVPAAAAFYCDHFHFTPLFTADWYVHLQSTEDPAINLALVAQDHETIPAPARGKTGGVILNFEVADPDAHHARLKAAGLTILLPLRDEAFGQRHFIAAAPDGVLIDVIRPIPPSADFAAQYAPDALPQ